MDLVPVASLLDLSRLLSRLGRALPANALKLTAASVATAIPAYIILSREMGWNKDVFGSSSVFRGWLSSAGLAGNRGSIGTGKIIKELNEQIYETQDNLIVFVFPSYEEAQQKLKQGSALLAKIEADPELRNCSVYYQIAKEMPRETSNDKTKGTAKGAKSDDERNDREVLKSGASVALYKGMRREMIFLSFADVSAGVEVLREFMKPRSAKVAPELANDVIEHVNFDSFESKVLQAASPTKPVLVQLYEKNCFLCFIMRPFLNSVNVLLERSGVPIKMVRLDIGENDFPKGCPVVRGTPTFVEYRSEYGGIRWEEFKPRDFVAQLCKTVTVPPRLKEELFALSDRVSVRLAGFSALAMWQSEAKLTERSEREMDSKSTHLKSTHLSSDDLESQSGPGPSESDFNSIVSDFMASDILSTDLLSESINGLNRDADDMEEYATVQGIKLGQKILQVDPLA